MSARCPRRSRLHRLDRAYDRLRAHEAAAPGRDGDRVLDGRQRAGGDAGRRVRAALQPVPAHEADHTPEDSREPVDHAGRGRGRSAGGRESAARGRADDSFEELNHPLASWPGLSRPSTSLLIETTEQGVDARDKRGHDREQPTNRRWNLSTSIPSNNIVIVGGGLAGLFCALKLAPHPVTL